MTKCKWFCLIKLLLLQIICVVTQNDCEALKIYVFFKINKLCLSAYDTYNFNGENIKEITKNETQSL